MCTLQSQIHLPNGDVSHTCAHCGTEFNRKSALDMHTCILQQTNNKPAMFGTPAHSDEPLQNNMIVIVPLDEEEEPFVDASAFCFVEFAENDRPTLRTRAVRNAKVRREKSHWCSYCGTAFALKGVLENHIRTHTGEKPYKCEECGAAFAQKCSLQRHMRVHTGEKTHRCVECGAAFSEKGNLRKHMLVHVGEKPYKCEECGCAFSMGNALRKHIRSHARSRPHM